MKIAILGSYPPIRGISPYCAEFANALSNHIKNIEFISFKKIYPAFLYPDGDNQTDCSTTVKTAPNLLIKHNLCWYNPFSWIKEAFSNNCDILHAQWWSFALLPIYLIILSITKLRRKAVVITVHNVLPHEASAIYRICTSLLFKTADHFIVHTEINKVQLVSCFKIAQKSITVIPHGPIGLYGDLEDRPDAGSNNLKKRLNIDDNCRVVLLFGAIREYKGVDTAIKALEKICNQGLNCHLIIAGKAWVTWEYYDKLIKQFKLEKRVTLFTDYIPSDQVKSFFDCADLVVLPYKHFDSQSGVASVAGAFGKPMVVSDTGGLSDWVANKRWALPPGDVDALSMAMRECLEDQKILDKMAYESKAMAELHSWDSIARKTSELYEEILK